MEFRTSWQIKKPNFSIGLQDTVLCLGSCFADHIGQKLIDNKFKTLVSPFGVLFNPLSIFQLLQISIENSGLPERGYLYNQGLYRHFYLHSDLASTSDEQMQELAYKAIEKTKATVDKAKFLIITLGTAYVYRHKESGLIAANCHKVPATAFDKYLLDIEEITSNFATLYALLKQSNPDLSFIFTLSPVRHMRDSFESNTLSKSVCRLAIDKIINSLDNTYYFPAYEIMLDDLRDYRFYADDMLHPSTQAIEYIWQKFIDAIIEPSSLQFITEWTEVRKAMHHRPFHPQSESHVAFLEKTLQKVQGFSSRIDVSQELHELNHRLNVIKSNTK